MRAPARRVNVVREAENFLVVPVVILKRHFNGDALRVSLAEDDILVNRVASGVEMLDKGLDAARIIIDFVDPIALVENADVQAWIQKRHLAKAFRERFKLKI